MVDLTPTPEQSDILSSISSTTSNLMISAYAGCGKTAILEMIANATTTANLLLCFNKSVATEAARRLPAQTTVRTFNSLGHKLWAAACSRRVTLNKSKTYDIFKSIADDASRAESTELWASYDIITSGVNLAKALGYIPPTHARAGKSLLSRSAFHHALDEIPSDHEAALIDRVLLESIRQSYLGVIDFNDQVYMPALFSVPFPTFPMVLVDEYQDLSPVNHAIVEKLCRSSRQIGVGDEAQAIYGFRGAATHSMSDAVAKFNMVQLPLSTSFRCPSNIVHNVHWRVPNFKANRAGGTIHFDGPILDNSAIICRNNAPLLRRAFSLLRNGHSISVAGTDIGNKLIRHLTKLGPETLSRTATLAAINSWLADRLERGSTSATDMAECMRIFAKQSTTLSTAIAQAKSVFSQTGTISFWTGHKAKGLEFERVYHLDSNLLKPDGQDPNVRYVIDTRTSESLTYISSEDRV